VLVNNYAITLSKAAMLMAALLLTGCFSDKSQQVSLFSGRALGTSYNVRFVGAASQVSSLQKGTDRVLNAINQSMSTYLPRSELSQLNENIGSDWIPISDDLSNVIQVSQYVSQLSNGAFDITVGPLVDLWGFGPQGRREIVPDSKQLEAVFSQIGYESLLLSEDKTRIKKLAPRQLDLSAVAKGYAVDKIAEYLDLKGVDNYLVEVGGEMRLKGFKPNGDVWKIAIETPAAGARGVYKVIPITNVAIATSGDYRNYFEQEGVRYSHTLDPDTGYPITHNLASVTVIADSCATADAWATALNVLGVQPALELAEKHRLAILLIENNGDEFIEHSSSAYKQLVN